MVSIPLLLHITAELVGLVGLEEADDIAGITVVPLCSGRVWWVQVSHMESA